MAWRWQFWMGKDSLKFLFPFMSVFPFNSQSQWLHSITEIIMIHKIIMLHITKIIKDTHEFAMYVHYRLFSIQKRARRQKRLTNDSIAVKRDA